MLLFSISFLALFCCLFSPRIQSNVFGFYLMIHYFSLSLSLLSPAHSICLTHWMLVLSKFIWINTNSYKKQQHFNTICRETLFRGYCRTPSIAAVIFIFFHFKSIFTWLNGSAYIFIMSCCCCYYYWCRWWWWLCFFYIVNRSSTSFNFLHFFFSFNLHRPFDNSFYFSFGLTFDSLLLFTFPFSRDPYFGMFNWWGFFYISV